MTKKSSAITDSESETSTSHNNDYNISLIVKRMAKLEAENARLQELLINNNAGMNEQTKPINKRKLIILSDGNTSNDESMMSKEKKKSKREILSEESYNLNVNKYDVSIFI